MLDTHPEIAVRYRKMMMRKSGEERLRMACSMFDTARQIVRISILGSRPDVTDYEMKREIFLRFYGHEFSREYVDRLFQDWSRRNC